MRSIGFLFFLLFLGGFALVSLKGRQPADPGSPGDTAFADTAWRVVSIGGKSLPADASLSLEFDSAAGLSGDSGCNYFSGRYERVGDAFSVGALRATRKACADERGRREKALFDALAETRRAVIDDDRLALESDTGKVVATLERLTPP